MRRNRLVYGLVLCISMMLCYTKQTVWASVIGYTLLFLPLASLIYILFIYRSFTYEQRMDKKSVVKGESVTFYFEVCNSNKFPYPDIEVRFYGVDSILGRYFQKKRVSVDARSKTAYAYELTCKYRGYYEIGMERIDIIDFLGLFRLPYRVFNPTYITVYPRIIPLKSFYFKKDMQEESDLLSNRQINEGNMLSDVRNYAYGDHMRQIHWKASAKRQSLMVRNRESTMSPKTYLVLDTFKNNYGIELNTLLEDRMIECTVSLLYYCVKQLIPVSWIRCEGEVEAYLVASEMNFQEAYQMLFQLQMKDNKGFGETLKVLRTWHVQKNNIILVTSKLSDSFYEQCCELRMEGNELVLIYASVKKRGEEEERHTQKIMTALGDIGIQSFLLKIDDDIAEVLEG